MVNVRFYRLETLPSFVLEKHNGIFVHVTKTMQKTIWTLSDGSTKVDPATLWMEPEKVGESVERINLVKWLSTRHITEIASGLWFGGENGWELLSNETNSSAIDAAIEAKINALDVNGYAQAEITTATNSSTLTIKGIKEVDGKIGIPVDTENRDLNIKIDGVYTESNKIATQSTVTTAIEALDVNTAVQAVTFNTSEVDGNTTLTFKGIKEVDGKIAQGDEQTPNTFIVGDAKLKIQIGSNQNEAFEVFSANAKENKSIFLDGNVFKKDENNVISVITPTALASDNRLVTEKDVANLAGAMHYKGTVSSLEDFKKIIDNTDSDSDAEEAGNVYIATGDFTHGNNVISIGDMIVFNGATNYNVIQSNITLGTGSGQIAANSAALSKDKLVVASGTGIETIDFDKTNLTDTTEKNTRTLSYTNGDLDLNGLLYHSATITDTFKVIGNDFTKSINITSTNRSIEIAANASENATGVVVDLVWNTIIE